MPHYRNSDIEVIYRRGDWHSWADIVDWLESRLRGDEQADNELSETESQELLADFRALRDQNVPFHSDPEQAYAELERLHRAGAGAGVGAGAASTA